MGDNWNNSFMTIAEEFAKQSTCARLHVGAVLVKDKRVISCGYNGVPSGMKHCQEVFEGVDMSIKENKDKHHEFSAKYELHAEQNCIAYAARSGVGIDKSCTLYVTTEPCMDCAKLIAAAGIGMVVYRDAYDRCSEGREFLKEAGITVISLEFKNHCDGLLKDLKWEVLQEQTTEDLEFFERGIRDFEYTERWYEKYRY